MHRKISLIALGAVLTAGAVLLIATDAEAKRSGRYQQWEFDTRDATKGYDGFSGGSGIGNYCSYRREPQRRCWDTASGGEACKIVSWRLIQKCY